MTVERALVIDDNAAYREAVAAMLTRVGFDTFATESADEAEGVQPGASLIVLDNLKTRDESGVVVPPNQYVSYWPRLLSPLRQKHPQATILLVTRRSDTDLKNDVSDLNERHPNTEFILGHDPFIVYLWKGRRVDGVPEGEGAERENAKQENAKHAEQLEKVARNVWDRLGNRRHLQGLLVAAALEAGERLLHVSLGELRERLEDRRKRDPSLLEWQQNKVTYYMDIVAEQSLIRHFLPTIHDMRVVICTEEKGVHNGLYHRISNPEFFVFSDPFDGSKAFREFSDRLVQEGHGERLLKDVVEDEALMADWGYGPRSLNSPVVSVVLTERHQVVGAVILNLFTGDLYLSVDTGNYIRNFRRQLLDGAETESLSSITNAIRERSGRDDWQRRGWKPLDFRAWKGPREGEPQLFLCALHARARKSGRRNVANEHAETCVYSLLPDNYDWMPSFNYRLMQKDFTPGPGRILFLTECHTTRQYESGALRDPAHVNRYRCILSAGEPITEWVGWLAFLRHARGLSAYCLRERPQADEEIGVKACPHRRYPDDPATMMPEEQLSIFRDGYVDFGVLQTAYATEMRKYKDTLVVVFDEDPAWQQKLRQAGGTSAGRFVRIPLMQADAP